jgi:hypothetical protein
MNDDFYEIGLLDDDTGLIDYSPPDVSRQMENVQRFLAVVNGDVVRDVSKTGSTGFLKAWQTSVWEPWKEFYENFKSIWGTTNHLRDSTYERAEKYRQMGLRFRENLAAKVNTGTVVTPVKIPEPIKVPPKGANKGNGSLPSIDLPPKFSSGGFPWKWLFIGAGVATGGYLLYKNWPVTRAVEALPSPSNVLPFRKPRVNPPS